MRIIRRGKANRSWSEADLKGINQEHYIVAKSFNGPFSTAEFNSRYREMYPSRNEGSFLVSDYAYNNEQEAKDDFPSFLEMLGRANYQFIGLDEGQKRKASRLRARERLPAKDLRKVKAADLWFARQQLLETRDYTPFDDSDEYDVLLDDGQRLPPKALFGKALSESLKLDVLPKHFTGGESSTCFRILREHGYEIVKKGVATPEPPGSSNDTEWREGGKKLHTHFRSERQTGLAAAKREQFSAEHGNLYCEHCGLVPTEAYESKYAESCIEVHHAHIAVADMQPGHVTKLEDLQCLCANCHRIEHRRLRFEDRT